jgi:hypothetical protein
MAKVELETEEWQRVLAIIATASWTQANPLLMKIGEQLKAQANVGVQQGDRGDGHGAARDRRPTVGT